MQFGIFSVGDVTPDPITGTTPTEGERIKAVVRGVPSPFLQIRVQLVPVHPSFGHRQELLPRAAVRANVRVGFHVGVGLADAVLVDPLDPPAPPTSDPPPELPVPPPPPPPPEARPPVVPPPELELGMPL